MKKFKRDSPDEYERLRSRAKRGSKRLRSQSPESADDDRQTALAEEQRKAELKKRFEETQRAAAVHRKLYGDETHSGGQEICKSCGIKPNINGKCGCS